MAGHSEAEDAAKTATRRLRRPGAASLWPAKSGNSRVLLNFSVSTEFAHSTEFSPFLLLTIPVGPPYEKCRKGRNGSERVGKGRKGSADQE